MEHIIKCIGSFFREAPELEHKTYNEAALQHELGYWLRSYLPCGARVQFERPASYFFKKARGLVKKEIDIVVSYPDSNKNYAIELKCPRQGQHPEQMFKACQDLQFLEQLTQSGFNGGIFVMHVIHSLFYQSGSIDGIYAHFRDGRPIEGNITKPTGSRNQIATLQGSYRVNWEPCEGNGRYWMQAIS